MSSTVPTYLLHLSVSRAVACSRNFSSFSTTPNPLSKSSPIEPTSRLNSRLGWTYLLKASASVVLSPSRLKYAASLESLSTISFFPAASAKACIKVFPLLIIMYRIERKKVCSFSAAALLSESASFLQSPATAAANPKISM
jgi:hypothetical protein